MVLLAVVGELGGLMRTFCLLLWLLGVAVEWTAALELGFPFRDHAVLQAGKPLPVWGRAESAAEVLVRLGEREKVTRAGSDGSWRVEFASADPSATGVSLRVRSGESEIVVNDLVFGEVWVASGQSNMRWRLRDCVGGPEAVRAGDDDHLRVWDLEGRLPTNANPYPVNLLKGINETNFYETEGWQRAGPTSLGAFSGVGYFFARRLRQELGVPVGVIHLAVGGSPMEAHLPPETLAAHPDWREFADAWWGHSDYPAWCRGRAALNLRAWFADPPEERAPAHPFAPGFLWKAGVSRILPFPVRGILWYQGESNATVDGGTGPAVGRTINREKFESLIRSWREGWGEENLPFYFVQLPGLNRDWEEFREMQREVSCEVPETGMVVTIDVGHPTNVHPRDKRPVGDRLAHLALRGTYGRKEVLVSPELRGVDFQGARVVVSFDRQVVSKGGVPGFESAGEDGVFRKAQAMLAGRRVVVEDPLGREVKGVRYAWADHPVAALTGPEGLPVGPFWEQERNEKDQGERRGP